MSRKLAKNVVKSSSRRIKQQQIACIRKEKAMWKALPLVRKMSLLLVIALISLPGCGKKNNQAKKELLSQVDIPVAVDGVKSFFDQDLLDEIALESGSMAARPVDPAHDYAWV